MKKCKSILSFLICSSMVAANAIPAFAYNTYNRHVLSGGVSSIKYHVSTSASDLENTINSAASSWNNADSKVSLKETSSTSGVPIKFYYEDSAFDSGDTDIVARTDFYLTNRGKWTDGESPTADWSQAHIHVHESVYNSLTTSNTNGVAVPLARQGTIAHEIGHAMGLAHNNNQNVLMCQMKYKRTVYTPQNDDINGINSLYSNNKLNFIKEDSTTSSAADIDNSISYIASEEDSINPYENINDLANSSNAIIQGKIEYTKSYFNEDSIYTDVKVRVVNCLAGSLKNGDIITVRVHGGTLEGENAKKFRAQLMKDDGIISDNVSSKKIEEIADGLDNFKNGDNSLFFLKYVNNKYIVTGSHQGRFKLTNDNVQLQDEFKNKYKDINTDSFIKDIKNSISK